MHSTSSEMLACGRFNEFINQSIDRSLYNNWDRTRDVIGQKPMVYCTDKLSPIFPETPCHCLQLFYKINEPHFPWVSVYCLKNLYYIFFHTTF